MHGKNINKPISIDLFSGCGGLSLGMEEAGFDVQFAIENNKHAIKVFEANHKNCEVIPCDITEISVNEIKKKLNGDTLHLLAGCPPCQGFSTIRKLNKKKSKRDDRNSLIEDYLRFVEGLKPLTIMMENVPGLQDYHKFSRKLMPRLRKLGYNPHYRVVNVKKYGVPQSRKRLVLVGSILGDLKIAKGTEKKVTVRQVIGNLPIPSEALDPMQKIVANHSERIMERIKATPKDGGSWKDLPEEYWLECHKESGVGFKDVYGRLRWDDHSTTITGGCLNPSKGRFLHPEQDRVITPREASLLQTFPKNYKFSAKLPKYALAAMIGNALPPKFSYVQSANIKTHLDQYLKN